MFDLLVRLVGRLLTPVVLVVSGAYLVIYLYRWEWNRALISGLFFLAAEVAYVGASLRREIRSLAARAAAAEEQAERRLHARLGETAAHPARPFGWLRDSVTRGTGVFVPVLLGAGMILSALAFAVERIAGALARNAVDPITVHHLVGLEPLDRGLLSPRPEGGRPRQRPVTSPVARAGRLVGAALLAVAGAGAIDLLADATQSRPAPIDPDTSTTIDLQVEQRRARSALAAAEALAVACQGTLRGGTEVTHIAAQDDDRVEIVVEPGLSELRRRRLFGCLEDATVDLVQAHVIAWHDARRQG